MKKLLNLCKTLPFTNLKTLLRERNSLSIKELRTIKKRKSRKNKLRRKREKTKARNLNSSNLKRKSKLIQLKQELLDSKMNGKPRPILKFNKLKLTLS